MYGWRGKIGLIVPSVNSTMEFEFNKMVPEGVLVLTTRLFFEIGLPTELEAMAVGTEKAAELLKTADVDLIVYGCTSGSLIKGAGWDKEIMRRIEERAGVPAITTATAVIEAFRELKVGKVAVATPYVDEVNTIEKAFFEAHGVKVVNIRGLGYKTGEELHRESAQTAYVFAKRVNDPEADCLFISCTDYPTIDVLRFLENDLGKPVISSNSASLWAALKKLGINDKIEKYGEILRRL